MLDHKHILVNAKVKKPPTEPAVVNDWLTRLVAAVGMKLVIGPFSHYVTAEGNEGLTGACCIETSHCAIHVWDKVEEPYLRFDLYSCACFEPQTVLNLIAEFEPSKLTFKVFDRNGMDIVSVLK